MLQRLIDRIVRIVFCVCAVLFCIYFAMHRIGSSDRNPPVITVTGADAVSAFSCSAQKSDLLSDVLAEDAEDGDLTASVVVESISTFAPDGTRTVTYAVCDSDNHVTKLQRRIRYTDYEPPKFSLNSQLCFTTVSVSAIADTVHAYDVLDGDISSQIKINSYQVGDDYDRVLISVSNSAGDMSQIPLYVSVVNTMNGLPRIALTDYIIYLAAGDPFNASTYLSGVTVGTTPMPRSSVRFDTSEVDMTTPGVYTVTYSAETDNGITGYSHLTVIVR
ncbi:MAG: DUF5011 domain-containing protein [Clostridia bacterium]|nr:DUF5011 domain-containing protein [Clostridia bacterium]